MKKTLGKTLWLIAGILLIFVGIVTIFNPSGTVGTIAFVLGFALLLTGIFDFIVFLIARDTVFGQKWVLKDGILNLILAVLLLCNHLLVKDGITYLFAMWIIVTGLSRFMTAFELKKASVSGWVWLSIMGFAGILLGFLSFFEPVVSMFAISLLIGVSLILYGATLVILWWYMQQLD